MIDNSTITRLMTQAGITITAGTIDGDKFALERFARACFEEGRQYAADRIIEEVRERFDAESA